MTGSTLRPSQQLLVNLFDEARIARLGTLQAFMDKGGNVFDLVQRRQADLCKEFKLTAHEGRLLLQRSYSLARYLAREFREQRLTRHEDAGRGPRTGVRALVDGPTFADLFKPDLANSSPAGSIESSVSPVAYLMSIIQWALLNIEPSGAPGQSIGLNMRRPDLWALLIDEGAVNRVEPAISIVTEVLMANIEANKQIPLDIDGLLITTRYPNTLPFDRSWQTIESSVKARRTSNLLGDIVRLTDLQYPYFKETGARGANSDIALRMTSGLAPGQQALLTEPGHTPASSSLGDKSPVVPWVNPRTRHVVEPSNTPLEDFFGTTSTVSAIRICWTSMHSAGPLSLIRPGWRRCFPLGSLPLCCLPMPRPCSGRSTKPILPRRPPRSISDRCMSMVARESRSICKG